MGVADVVGAVAVQVEEAAAVLQLDPAAARGANDTDTGRRPLLMHERRGIPQQEIRVGSGQGTHATSVSSARSAV